MPRMTNRHAKGSNIKDKGFGGKRRVWDAMNNIRSLDSFAKEVPAFKIQG